MTITFTGITYAHTQSNGTQLLNDHRLTTGTKNIAEAWFSHPTTRYQHFVLGAEYEPTQINVKLRNGKTLSYRLDRNSVFEDRIPRLEDINNDGEDEIIVVRAYLDSGAALSVFHITKDKIALLAETPNMGHPFGWLNPAGIADFDGDGKKEIAFVRKPHVLGRLELWQYKSGKLVLEQSTRNVSNHSIGSKKLGLSAVADFDKDGINDLALPSKSMQEIKFFSFSEGVKEISSKKLSSRVKGNFQLVETTNSNGVRVTLENGTTVTILP